MIPEIEDIRSQFQELRNKVGELEGTIRVTKHDVANVQQSLLAFGLKFEKFEEKVGAKIDGLVEKLGALNVKQEKGASFFAGITAVFVTGGSIIAVVVKLLFGGHG